MKELDKLIKEGLEKKDSIYQIKIKNNDEIRKSVNKIYRYINIGFFYKNSLCYFRFAYFKNEISLENEIFSSKTDFTMRISLFLFLLQK